VSVRYQLPDTDRSLPGPHFTDVVGELIDVADDVVTILSRHGEVVVRRADVVAVRVVPPRPARAAPPHLALSPAVLQRLMVAGHPPLEREWLGDWLFRAAGGFTGRANSLLPLGDPGVQLSDAVDRMEQWYRLRDLAPAVTVFGAVGFDVSADSLGRYLLARGYERHFPTLVMTASVARSTAWPALPDGYRLDRADRLTDDFLSVCEERVAEFGPSARRVLEGPRDQAFLCVYADSDPVAGMRVPAHDGWAGIFGLRVDPAHRGRGIARALTGAAMAFAADRGVASMYLQVTEDTVAARRLYETAGFVDHHAYCYLRTP
jgi:N-acetylglutamate synthase